MGNVNRGKQFEGELKKGFEKYPTTISYTRLHDAMGGLSGVRSICDFIIYASYRIFYIEAKSRRGNTFSLTDVPSNQYMGMLNAIVCKGVIAGFIIWYIEHKVTVFVPIQEVKRLKDLGYKSINIKDILNGTVLHKIVPSVPKRVLCTYPSMRLFLREVKEWLD